MLWIMTTMPRNMATMPSSWHDHDHISPWSWQWQNHSMVTMFFSNPANHPWILINELSMSHGSPCQDYSRHRLSWKIFGWVMDGHGKYFIKWDPFSKNDQIFVKIWTAHGLQWKKIELRSHFQLWDLRIIDFFGLIKQQSKMTMMLSLIWWVAQTLSWWT